MPRWLALVIPEAIGTEWRWYRRALGGHWERWYVDSPVNSEVWHRCPLGCTKHTLRRPSMLCRGIPTCEDWS